MSMLLQDLRYGLRTMLKRPGFTLIAVMTLALGIGSSTAIFTVVDAAVIRGLPYRSPERLYHMWERTPQKEFDQREFSYPDYQDYLQNQVCDLAAYTGGGTILNSNGESERVFAPLVSANFFSVLGVDAIKGRTFQTGEDKQGGPRVALLSYGLWQTHFGGSEGIVGQQINLAGDSYTVIGVLPQSFQFAMRPADLFLPYQPTQNQLTRRFLHGTNLIARLKPGVSPAQAHAELSLTTTRIEQQFKDSHAGTSLKLIPLQEQVVGQVKPILMTLLAAVGFVLLIACANVASLLLTRSLGRQKEVGIRVALGASRWRVVRQLLTESVLLSLAGGALGLLFAYWGTSALVSLLPANQINALPFLQTLKIDARMLGFSFGLSVLTGIVFGLAPALQSSRLDLSGVLKEGGRQTSGGGSHRLRSGLVMTEIALAVVLLVGAGLLLKSLVRLLKTDPGFNPQNVLTMTVVLPAAKYTEANSQINVQDQLRERVQALPGVAGAGTVNILPLQPGNTTRVNVEGDPIPPPGQELEANIRTVSDNYFQTLGVPLISGRMFDSRDKANAPQVVIIGKTMAERMFAGRDPIGRRLKYAAVEAPALNIIGVAGDVKITGLDQETRPVIYFPFRQNSSTFANLVVRTNADPTAVSGSIRNEIRNLEPAAAVFNVQAMPELISNSPAAFMRRFPAILIGVFAGLALLLSSIGIYGVVSYSVSQQTHHIGVRMALGARASDILKMVMKQGLFISVVGITIGIAAAVGLMRLLQSLLFGVAANDVSIFALVVGALFIVALLACYLPARRATKVDPLVALRYE
ncbi:MAG TPA: ABC transporter permease [Pyrinomonadaceae bacterium]|nr:ABC transporter permease [Pyrinomonadaceae bacterium]